MASSSLFIFPGLSYTYYELYIHPMCFSVRLTVLPLRGGVSVPSFCIWVWAYHYSNQQNMVKETLCAFWGWVTKRMQLLLSSPSLGCSPSEPATKLWGSPDHTVKPHGKELRTHQQRAPTARHVSSRLPAPSHQVLCWGVEQWGAQTSRPRFTRFELQTPRVRLHSRTESVSIVSSCFMSLCHSAREHSPMSLQCLI